MEATARKQRAITSERIDPSKPASIVIDRRFNGLTNFCEKTGFPISTANDWRIKGFIPPTRRDGSPCQSHILAVAEKEGIEMDPADFVERPDHEKESSVASAPTDEGAAAAHRPTPAGVPPPVAAAPLSAEE